MFALADALSLKRLEERLRSLDIFLDSYMSAHHPKSKYSSRKWKEVRWDSIALTDYRGEKISFIWKHIEGKKYRTICEIGINAGHSPIVWLESNEDLNVLLFDLDYRPYSRAAYLYLQYVYGERCKIIEGDSKETLPEYLLDKKKGEHAELCDVIAIDGIKSYDGRKVDMDAMMRLATKDTIFILDDSNTTAVANRDVREDTDAVTRLYIDLINQGRMKIIDYSVVQIPDGAQYANKAIGHGTIIAQMTL